MARKQGVSVERVVFEGKVFNPRGWLESAEQLLTTVEILTPYVEEYWETFRRWHRRERKKPPGRESNLHAITLMLAGLAIENLCKSWIVRSMDVTERELVRRDGRLPRAVQGHDIFVLVSKTGMTLEPEDEDLLRRMQRAIEWSGRYPVPVIYQKSASEIYSDGKRRSTAWLGGRDMRKVSSLLGRLTTHLGLRYTPSSAGRGGVAGFVEAPDSGEERALRHRGW